MKTIKLFLFLSFVLWADFKLDIPQNIDVTELENIIKNGWNDSNKTLNNFIVSNTERIMPEILEKLKKPVLVGVATKEDFSPLPRILLTRDDYIWIFTYVKYLEFNNKIDVALNLYLKSLMGLNNMEDKTMLSMIYHLTIEELIVDNLKSNIHLISKLQYEEIEKMLILNTDILRDTLMEDQQKMIEILTLNGELPKKILTLMHGYSEDFINFYMKIKNKDELAKFKIKFNKQIKEIETKYTNLMEKHIIPHDMDRDKLIASYLFIISLPKLNLIQDVWKNIERNKKLLDSL
jgi:hypothetical protein